jgi:hypothetical protein
MSNQVELYCNVELLRNAFAADVMVPLPKGTGGGYEIDGVRRNVQAAQVENRERLRLVDEANMLLAGLALNAQTTLKAAAGRMLYTVDTCADPRQRVMIEAVTDGIFTQLAGGIGGNIQEAITLTRQAIRRELLPPPKKKGWFR